MTVLLAIGAAGCANVRDNYVPKPLTASDLESIAADLPPAKKEHTP